MRPPGRRRGRGGAGRGDPRRRARADVVLISDYQKGTVTRETAQAGASRRREREACRCLVDPKVPHIDYYAGASLVTPNHHEAEAVTLRRIRTDDEARTAARAFRERARCESVLITRGEHGMWLLAPDGEGSTCRPRRAKSRT